MVFCGILQLGPFASPSDAEHSPDGQDSSSKVDCEGIYIIRIALENLGDNRGHIDFVARNLTGGRDQSLYL